MYSQQFCSFFARNGPIDKNKEENNYDGSNILLNILISLLLIQCLLISDISKICIFTIPLTFYIIKSHVFNWIQIIGFLCRCRKCATDTTFNATNNFFCEKVCENFESEADFITGLNSFQKEFRKKRKQIEKQLKQKRKEKKRQDRETRRKEKQSRKQSKQLNAINSSSELLLPAVTNIAPDLKLLGPFGNLLRYLIVENTFTAGPLEVSPSLDM